MSYSVLMTVYKKEDPLFFDQAIQSILKQTVVSDDFVLVCDGELTNALNNVIKKHIDKLRVFRTKKKVGLCEALNTGLKECRHELVARMDSDDISIPDRCERELKVFEENPDLSVISGTVQEFFGEPKGDGLLKKRVLPETQKELVAFSRRRNPFNHPAVMFKKSDVIASGGYKDDYFRFEDYDLWIRMFQNGYKGYNIQDVILYMRVSSDFYKRRGGKKFAKDTLRFHRNLINTGWSTNRNYITSAVPHAMVCLMPNSMRKAVYKILRKS